MKKLLLILLLFLSLFSSAQKFQYGVEVGYGLDQTISEVKVYNEFKEKYKFLDETGSKYFFDYLGLWQTEGEVFYFKGFIDYNPVKWVKLRTGVGLNVYKGEFFEYGSNDFESYIIYNYSDYSLSYLTIPLELVLLDNCWIKPYAALNSGMRVATSENMRDTFSDWEEKSNSDSFKLQTRRCKFDYELGVKLQIWKTELSISRYKGITPFIVVPDFYENKPDGSVNPSEGETAHYNSGFQFKLSIPIGEFELK